ncbi:MAG: MucR family transcriptional regulator [Desulfuromonadales bacterium]|nr:MucR family transcriptional regulator [Desulfuromonadales bacterium]
MPTLLEMASNIVAAHASTSAMTKDELLVAIREVHAALSDMEKGTMPTAQRAEEPAGFAISKRKAFSKNTVTCMICGKEGMKTLARHLNTAHGVKPGEYRKQFDIPRTQPLAARAYSESRQQMALDRDLGANLAKAREARKAKAEGSPKKTRKASSKKNSAKTL